MSTNTFQAWTHFKSFIWFHNWDRFFYFLWHARMIRPFTQEHPQLRTRDCENCTIMVLTGLLWLVYWLRFFSLFRRNDAPMINWTCHTGVKTKRFLLTFIDSEFHYYLKCGPKQVYCTAVHFDINEWSAQCITASTMFFIIY